MAEERRCQAPTPCANNCGFFGCPATQDLCSKCHRDLHLKEPQSSSTSTSKHALVTQTLISPPSSSDSSSPSSSAAATESSGEGCGSVAANRCMACRKRVGVMGFTCRCGMVLCGPHRYPELHGCRFDFKRLGRDEIARANPLVKAPKLHDKI